MNFVDSKLHKTVYPRALLEIFIHYDESRNSLTKNILYLVHHVRIINIRKK
jgi:hypothetical protein